jgi:hypothetical protein
MVDKTRLNQIIESLKARKHWYQKAIDMANGDIPWDNHFDWPYWEETENVCQDPTVIYKWRGAISELKNTIDMLETI